MDEHSILVDLSEPPELVVQSLRLEVARLKFERDKKASVPRRLSMRRMRLSGVFDVSKGAK